MVNPHIFVYKMWTWLDLSIILVDINENESLVFVLELKHDLAIGKMPNCFCVEQDTDSYRVGQKCKDERIFTLCWIDQDVSLFAGVNRVWLKRVNHTFCGRERVWKSHRLKIPKVVGSSPTVTNMLCSWVRHFTIITPLNTGENGYQRSSLQQVTGGGVETTSTFRIQLEMSLAQSLYVKEREGHSVLGLQE